MSKVFVSKNIKLSLDFDNFITQKPDILKRVPSGAWIIFTKKGDNTFNKQSRQLGLKVKKNQRKRVVEARKEGSAWILELLNAK